VPYPDQPLFPLDHSLNPAIAEALRLVGYNVRSVTEVFGVPPGGVKDPTIIEWLAANQVVWLTTDVAAKKLYAQTTNLNKVSVVWYRQPKRGLPAKDQHWIITKFLKRIASALSSGDIIHFRVGAGEKARLQVEWRRRPDHLV